MAELAAARGSDPLDTFLDLSLEEGLETQFQTRMSAVAQQFIEHVVRTAVSDPIVMPGSYTVTIELGDVSSSETAVIEADPRRPMTLSDRMARQDVLISLHQLAPALNQATLSARRLGEQFNETSALLEEYDGNTESLLQDIGAMQTELEEISDGLGEARSWAGVANAIQGSSTLPTEDQLWQADAAWDAVPPLIERLNTLITEKSPAVYSEMDAMGIRPSPGDALSVPRRGN